MPSPFPVERICFKASTLAFGAKGVAAEFREKYADVHFVEIAIEPIEETTDAIPLATVIFIFRFALHYELKLFFVELRP